MSITVEKNTGTGITDASATASKSFASLPSTGATILVAVFCDDTTAVNHTLTCADNQSGTYIKDKEIINGNEIHAAIFRRSNIAAPSGTFTVTASCGGAGTYWSVQAISVLNLKNAGPVASSSNSGTSTAPTSGASGDSTQASTLAVAVANTQGGASSANEGFADPATFGGTATGNTAVSIGVSQSTNLHTGGEASYKVLTAQGTVSASWGTIQSGDLWTSVLAVYAENVAGPTTQLLTMRNNQAGF